MAAERQRPGVGGEVYREIVGLGEAYRAHDLTDSRAIYGDFSQVVVGVWAGRRRGRVPRDR